MNRKKGAALVVMMTAGIFLAFLLLHDKATPTSSVDPFTPKALASVKFPLYYPTSVPEGFHIDPESVTYPSDGVVVFSVTDSKGRKIYISQQGRSQTYNYGRFFDGVEHGQEFKTSHGQAIVGTVNQGQVSLGSLVTSKSWIIVNGSKQNHISANQLKALIMSFTQSH